MASDRTRDYRSSVGRWFRVAEGQHVFIRGALALEDDLTAGDMIDRVKEIQYLANRLYPTEEKVTTTKVNEFVLKNGKEFFC